MKPLNIHEAAGRYFGYFEQTFEFYRIVEHIFDQLDYAKESWTSDEIYDAIDQAIIYTEDQWEIIKAYCRPQEANWEWALENFCSDILTLANEMGVLQDD